MVETRMQVLFYTSIFSICCAVTHGFSSNDQLQCKDESNSPVDWYVLYKLPKVQTSSNPLIRKGLGYLYITNETVGTGWQLSTRSIGSNNSIPGITLAPLYARGNEDENLWNLYNDSPPCAPDPSHTYGHTKGVVMANKDRGFWLIHSVPNFPPVPTAGEHTRLIKNQTINITGKYDYPDSGTHYGQSFLCISLGSDQFDILGKQLMYNEIPVYGRNIPESLGEQYPILKNASDQRQIKDPPYTHKATIESLQSVQFTSFAKDGKWGKELYADFIGPQLQSNLDVQSWLNGRGKLPSVCSRRKIYNVRSLKFETANVDYTSTRDHSKWAITIGKNSDNRWVCIGDINRADTQFSRGGGAVCLKEPRLWDNYRKVVNDVETCTSK